MKPSVDDSAELLQLIETQSRQIESLLAQSSDDQARITYLEIQINESAPGGLFPGLSYAPYIDEDFALNALAGSPIHFNEDFE